MTNVAPSSGAPHAGVTHPTANQDAASTTKEQDGFRFELPDLTSDNLDLSFAFEKRVLKDFSWRETTQELGTVLGAAVYVGSRGLVTLTSGPKAVLMVLGLAVAVAVGIPSLALYGAIVGLREAKNAAFGQKGSAEAALLGASVLVKQPPT